MLVVDIMDYTKIKNLPGILLFIDFEKAFDSLEWTFLEKCLNQFGFWPDFIRWVNVFYKDIQSCIINNGLCSQYFNIVELGRGTLFTPTFLSLQLKS